MSNSTKLNLGLLATLVFLSMAAVYLAVSMPDDFYHAYESCKAENADLVLRVKYQIEGIPEVKEYVANYRHRPQLTRLVRRFQEMRGIIYIDEVPGENDQAGKSGWRESWSVTPYESPDGVELNIQHRVFERVDEIERVAEDELKQVIEVDESVKLPFLSNTDGRLGKVSFAARWKLH